MRVTTIPGSIVDIDGKATTDTSDARLEPLRMSARWDFAGATNLGSDGDSVLTYSYYDGDVAYIDPYNGNVGGPPATETSVESHGAGNEAAIGRVLNADFSTEMAELTKSMFVSQAANRVLAGAQLTKSNLMKLLE